MKKMNKQLVLVEFDGCSPFVYMIESKKKITVDGVAKYFEKTEGFNENRDSITLIEDVSTIVI